MDPAALILVLLSTSPADRLADAGRQMAAGNREAQVQLAQLAELQGEVGADAALALGRQLLQGGDAQASIPHLRRAAEEGGALASWGKLLLARALAEERPEAAIELLEGWPDTGSGPVCVEALLERADLQAAAGRPSGAARDFEAFLRSAGDHPARRRAAAERARALETAGDEASAMEAWWTIWLEDPGSPHAEEARERARALEEEASGRVIPEASPRQILAHAMRLRRVGRGALAVEELRSLREELRADGLTGEEPALARESLYLEADALYAVWKSREAVEAAERLLEAPDDWLCPALALVARASWLRTGQEEKAIATARRIEDSCDWSTDDRFEGREEGLWVRAHINLRANRPERAEPLLARIAEAPNRRRDGALWHLGLTRIRMERHLAAAEAFGRLAETTGSGGYRRAALYWEGRMRRLAGQIEASEVPLRVLAERWPASYYGRRAIDLLGEAALRRDGRSEGREAAVPEIPPALAQKAGAQRALRLERAGLVDLAGREWMALHDGEGPPPSGLVLRAARAFAPTRWAYQGVRLVRQYLGDMEETGQGPREAFYPRPFAEIYRLRAERSGIDPALAFAISRQESLFDPEIRSWAGAVGLMQLMPATAADEARRLGLPKPSEADLVDPDLNIRLGTAHLARLLDRFGSEPAAIAAYNAGGGRVATWLRERPLEGEGALAPDLWIDLIPITQTRLYVKGVLESLWEYRATSAGVNLRGSR